MSAAASCSISCLTKAEASPVSFSSALVLAANTDLRTPRRKDRWELQDLRERVVCTPKLLSLRQLLQDRYSGQFVFPKEDESLLRERWVDGEEGWTWFMDESL